jgi:transposase-like protein
MGKISPEEKIQWMEKIIQNKESISSVASKTGVHYMTVDKWLKNYKSIDQEVFFRKGRTKRTTEEKDSGRLLMSANLSESLILSLFLYFFTCFVTEDIPSQHAPYAGTCPPAEPSLPHIRHPKGSSYPLPVLPDHSSHTLFYRGSIPEAH